MLVKSFLFIDQNVIQVLFLMLNILIIIGLSPLNLQREEKATKILLIKTRINLMQLMFFTSLISSIIIYLALQKTNLSFAEYFSIKIKENISTIAIILTLSFLIKFFYMRYISVTVSKLKKKLRVSPTDEKISTIDESMHKFGEKLKYNPFDYIDIKKGVFVGLDKKKPIYISWDDYKEYNKEILGATRSGKGVVASMILYQKILKGWGCFFFDPKGDKFIPLIMKKACDKAGKKLIIIDFVDGKKGIYAPFRGGFLTKIKERTKQIFKVRRTGLSSDFYKGKEINMIDEALEKTNRGVEKIYNHLKSNRYNKDDETAIESIFKELSKIKQISTPNGRVPIDSIDKELLYPAQFNNKHVGGVSIARAIMESQVVYIRGDISDEMIRNLTKLLLTEVVQEVRRLYRKMNNHLSIDIDETKFLMSETVSDALSIILGFDCDITLQYQAIEDIETSIEKDIDMKALAESIHQNTQIKIIHGGLSDGTAEYALEKTGTITKNVEFQEKTKTHSLGAEIFEGEKTIKVHEEELFTKNDFLSMPQFTYCFLMKEKKARILKSYFVDVSDMKVNYDDLEK